MSEQSERQAAYDERLELKRERLEAAAVRARAESEQRYQHAHAVIGAMNGTPILIGHHSEKRHRRALERVNQNMSKSVELDRYADHLERRAASVGSAGISADDPSALGQLRSKLARMAGERDDMKRRNAIIRKWAKAGPDRQRDELIADGMGEGPATRLVVPQFGRPGYSFALTNHTANMRNVEKRIAELEAAEAREPVAGGDNGAGISWGEDRDLNRVWIAFPGKPDDATRTELKRAGFRWAPSLGCWQRQTSNAAIYHAQRVTGAQS